MREALFSQDGWGCQHVNQDTNWEVPSSPEPANKDPSGPPMWKPNINNGTDLWESNLRNGGQPPAQQVSKPSWGHTPSSNLGGTWGEDDDGVDSTSVWTGSANSATSTVAVGVNASGTGPNVGSTSTVPWGQGVVGVGIGGSGGNNNNTVAGALPVVTPVGASGTANMASAGPVASSVSNVGSAGNGWGDPREIRPMAGPMDMRNVDPRDPMRGVPSNDPRDLRMIDPRDPIRGDPRGISGRLNGTSEMWGHHQQISHNQLPNINKMVGQVVGAAGANVGGTSGSGGVTGGVPGNMAPQWGATQSVVGGPKDLSKQITGWEEPSPPPQRRNIPNYDDGTSLWGQQTRVPSGGTHWKDMTDSINRGHLMRGQSQTTGMVGSGLTGNSSVPGGGNNPNTAMTNVVAQSRLSTTIVPSNVGTQHKPDGSAMWVHPSNGGRNPVNTWGDESHNVSSTSVVTGSTWVDDKPNTGLAQMTSSSNSWSDTPSSNWGPKPNKLPTNTVTGGWSSGGVAGNDSSDLTNDWNTHAGGIVNKSQQQKLAGLNIGVGGLNIDMIKQSKQYRILVENGFKKEEVERALISANMNIEEAAELLRANSTLAMDGWRRHDETLGSYSDHSNSTGSGVFTGRYPVAGAQPSISFPPNNLLNNMAGSAVVSGANNPNMAALQVQKFLTQQGPHGVAVPSQSVNSNATVAFGQNSANASTTVNLATGASNQPSGQQIRMLGQQIQLAIHSGFISSQILTQPLTQATLNLLNQLLSNIKHLQAAQQSLSRGNNANPMAVNLAISKYKQQIQNLQNQINAQQAVYIKQQGMQQQNAQQQQQQHPTAHLSSSNTDYLRNHEAISALQGNFNELNLNKPGGYQSAPNQQSRLNQWKLPVLEKDISADNTDFSRAPGATKQNLSTASTNNMGPLGLQNDGTWSTGRNIGDGWPEPSIDNENKDWSVAQPSSATTYTDLVQEFEPGKPWKGSQIKNIEDDPSITPGSVARSPLSINPTPKDADIFSNTGKSSPTELPPLSLSSSTWSFNPNQNFPSWSDNTQPCATSELWSSPLNKSNTRGPPPGLSSNKSGSGVSGTTTSTATGSSNGWLPNRGVSNTNTTWTGGNTSWSSSWLLLKNLTAQIDGNTLRTLCIQHGPLVSFHLYLNQGIALCKYATREEANKAQMALNNCALGNTTIFAESPSENEVQNIMQHLPTSSSSSSNTTLTTTGGNNSTSSGATSAGTGGLTTSNSGNGGGGGGNTNVNTNNSNVVGGGGTCTTNNATNTSGVAVSGSVAAGGTSTSTNVNGGGAATNVGIGGTVTNKNSSICGNNSTVVPANVASVTTTVANNSTWRQQTTQNQALQSQSRQGGGRESDYDYISQFVCSIVDD